MEDGMRGCERLESKEKGKGVLTGMQEREKRSVGHNSHVLYLVALERRQRMFSISQCLSVMMN
jgi:hypothetical protein